MAHRRMFLVNFISRNDTNQFVPMFEIIYSIELVFIFLALIAASFVIFLAVQTPKLHKLIRLRIIFPITLASSYVCSRVVVMNHQYYGPSEYVETTSLIFCSMVMEVFISYMSALVGILALDRWVATQAWCWYESDANSTLLFFALQEAILFSIAFGIAYPLVFGYISGMESVYCFGVLILLGSTVYALVFRYNLKVMKELKRGAVLGEYSVSRTYQIKENIDLLTAFTKVARPIVIVCLPPFAFYPVYYLVPRNIGYDGLRFFSASMYHLWLSIATVVIISCLPYYYPPLLFGLKSKRNRASNDIHFQLIEKSATRKPTLKKLSQLVNKFLVIFVNKINTSEKLKLSSSVIVMECNGSLHYGFEFERTFFIDAIHILQTWQPVINIVLIHPVMLYQLWTMPNMGIDIRIAHTLTDLTLIVFDWLFNFGLRFYAAAPFAVFYCGGFLCNRLDISTIHLLLAILFGSNISCFMLYFGRMHNRTVFGTSSIFNFSKKAQLLLFALLNIIIAINVAGFAVFGVEADNAHEIKNVFFSLSLISMLTTTQSKACELQFLLTKGGRLIIYGTFGNPQYFRNELYLLGVSILVIGPIPTILTIDSLKRMRECRTFASSQTQKMTYKLLSVFIVQLEGAMLHMVVPLALIFTTMTIDYHEAMSGVAMSAIRDIGVTILTLDPVHFPFAFILLTGGHRKIITSLSRLLRCSGDTCEEYTAAIEMRPDLSTNIMDK